MLDNIKLIIIGLLIGFIISIGMNISRELNSINNSLSNIVSAMQEQNSIFNSNPDEVNNETL